MATVAAMAGTTKLAVVVVKESIPDVPGIWVFTASLHSHPQFDGLDIN
jgi:hypothetical protein